MWGAQFPNAQDMKKAFGTDPDDLGLTIFRIRIASNSNEWPLIVNIANEAQKYGAKIVASPWSPPARSSYFGAIDLAGFRKDRFYLYQAHWRPDLPMAHILPYWTWPGREGEITPVHVFSSGDKAELFLNGKSLCVRTRGRYEYRFRWDSVVYEPGTLSVEIYKNGKKWAASETRTAGAPAKLELSAGKTRIEVGGKDLAFVAARILDGDGAVAPTANNLLRFTISGSGEIVATDNGDPTDMTPFTRNERKAFNGHCLAIVRGTPGKSGAVRLKVESDGLQSAEITIHIR